MGLGKGFAVEVTDLARRTLSLCAIPSVIGDERALCDHVEAWAKQHFPPGEVRRINHSLVLGRLDDPRPTIALVGHLDTVPVHPEDAAPRIQDGRVYGLGASDMKGGLAVMMALAEQLPRDSLPVNLALVLYEREEGPYAENGLEPVFDAVRDLDATDLAICMEPTDGELQVGCVGSLHATVTFEGQSAHSARPWQGENAIHKAGELLLELHARKPVKVTVDGLDFFEVTSVTKAAGGRARNVVPERFELNLNHRFAPGKSVDQAVAELEALVGGRARVEITDRSPSGRVCLDNPHVQRFIRATGSKVASKQAWTDVARFGVRGVDAVNFGPGETAQAHQANESAPIAALDAAYLQLKRFLEAAP